MSLGDKGCIRTTCFKMMTQREKSKRQRKSSVLSLILDKKDTLCRWHT